MHALNCPACGKPGLGEPYLSCGIVYSECGHCRAEVEMTPLPQASQGQAEFGVLSTLRDAPLYKTGRYRLPDFAAGA